MCHLVRDDENLCGAAGKRFEQRQTIEAYVEAAPITKFSRPMQDYRELEQEKLGNKYPHDEDIASHIKAMPLPPGVTTDKTIKPFTDYTPDEDK